MKTYFTENNIGLIFHHVPSTDEVKGLLKRGEVQDGKSPSSLLFGAISPSSLNLV